MIEPVVGEWWGFWVQILSPDLEEGNTGSRVSIKVYKNWENLSGLLGGHPVQIGVCVSSRITAPWRRASGVCFLPQWWSLTFQILETPSLSFILLLWSMGEKHCALVL